MCYCFLYTGFYIQSPVPFICFVKKVVNGLISWEMKTCQLVKVSLTVFKHFKVLYFKIIIHNVIYGAPIVISLAQDSFFYRKALFCIHFTQLHKLDSIRPQ